MRTEYSPKTAGASLEVRDLRFNYPEGPPILHELSLRLDPGETVAVIGQNGSGKTTLAKHFIGLLRPSRGSVLVDDQDICSLKTGDLAGAIGFVFQDPDHQIFSPTVREEISFGPENLGLESRSVIERVEESLAYFDLSDHADGPPANLSYGLRRKVTLAAVHAMRPRALVLDEPTSGLDGAGQAVLLSWLKDRQAAGVTILIISHNLRAIAACAGRSIVLQDGLIAADGDTASIFSDDQIMTNTGLRPPQITRLAGSLVDQGIPPDLVTVESFCEAVGQRMQSKGFSNVASS